nr:AEC family transporter [Desulfobulbaceae bacterium]
MENFVIIISYLLIGMALRHVPKFPKETSAVFNLYVIYVCLPALTFLKIPELELSSQLLVPVLMPWGMLLFSACIIWAFSIYLKWDKGTTGALMLLIPMGNTSFLGIPMVRAFFGDAGVSFAVLYDQLGSFLALSTYGTIVLAYYSGTGKVSAREIAVRICTFPPFIALMLALVFRSVAIPRPVSLLLESLAATLVPVVMIAVGFQLRLKLSPEVWKPLGVGLGVKLVVAPVAALGVCYVLGLNSLAAKVSVLEAGMPPMISAGAVAIMAGLSPSLTAALVGFGIVFSFVSLPILQSLLAVLG